MAPAVGGEGWRPVAMQWQQNSQESLEFDLLGTKGILVVLGECIEPKESDRHHKGIDEHKGPGGKDKPAKTLDERQVNPDALHTPWKNNAL